jgi:hypothetical protein
MRCLPKNKAQRRYMSRFWVMMALYVFSLLPITWLFKHHPPAGVLAYVLAALPSFPIIGLLIVIGLYTAEEKDEFERSIIMESQLWGMGATLAITSFWGFVEMFMPVAHLPAYLIAVIYWTCTGLATPIIRRRYR